MAMSDFSSAQVHLGIARLARMKPILAALLFAAMLDGMTYGSAETVQPARSFLNTLPVIPGTEDRAIYGNLLRCLRPERRSASVHILRCRGSKRCELPAGQPISNFLHSFSSAKILKIGPLPDGCLSIALIGRLKLEDAPPWAGTAYPGWRPFTSPP